MPPRMQMMYQAVGIDLIYSFVIILASLLIYFGTRELYELSSHKGIKYFRRAFIFFAVAYFARFITQFIFLSLEIPRNYMTQLGLTSLLALFIFMYATTAAILYLGASVHSGFFNKKYKEVIIHVFSLAIALLGIATQNIAILLLAQVIIVAALAITTYNREKKSKKKSPKIFLLYSALAIFLMLNILDLALPNFFQLTKILIYLFSITIFLFLLYRVSKRAGN